MLFLFVFLYSTWFLSIFQFWCQFQWTYHRMLNNWKNMIELAEDLCMGDVQMYRGHTDTWAMYRGVHMYGGLTDVQVAYRCTGVYRCTGAIQVGVQKYRGHTNVQGLYRCIGCIQIYWGTEMYRGILGTYRCMGTYGCMKSHMDTPHTYREPDISPSCLPTTPEGLYDS